jgi:16S rRNA pseudouridine516 synthase
MAKLRLDRFVSGQGAAERSKVKELMKKGLVTVDGKTVSDPGMKIDPHAAQVAVAGRRIVYKEHIYIMMNKPQGVVCASSDRRESTVIDLLPDELRRPGLFPAGRLDRDTEGMLIITDDGAFAHRMLAPASHVWKRYLARLDVPPDESDAQAFAQGIKLPGLDCLPAKLGISGQDALVYIREGKFHQIKRMFESRGKTVVYLKRLSMGDLELDEGLAPGQSRVLTPEETGKLLANGAQS